MITRGIRASRSRLLSLLPNQHKLLQACYWYSTFQTSLKPTEKALLIDWNESSSSKYPFSWLRDNCQCKNCVDESGQKIFDRSTLLNTKVTQISNNQASISLQWSDGHKSLFSLDWLRAHCLLKQSRESRKESQSPFIWDGKSLPQIPRLAADKVLGSEEGVLEWLDILHEYGICLLTNCGTVPSTVEQVALRMGPIFETVYGRIWDVIVKSDAENVAYTGSKISLHSDLLYYDPVPGFQFLHCLSQSEEGGENYFADSFRVAEDFVKDFPNQAEILSKVYLTYHKNHDGVALKYRRPVLEFDDNNEVSCVHLSPPFEGTLDCDVDLVDSFYEAYTNFCEYVESERYILRHKMGPGEMATFNNRRVFHAREAFTDSSRHLQGTYVASVDFANRLRLLKSQFGEKNFVLKKIGGNFE